MKGNACSEFSWVTQSDAAALAFLLLLLLFRRPTSYSALRYKQRRRGGRRREDRITNEWHVSVCLRLSVRLFACSPPSLPVGHSYPLPFPNSSYPMFWAVEEKKSKYALLVIWSFFFYQNTDSCAPTYAQTDLYVLRSNSPLSAFLFPPPLKSFQT